MRARPASRRPLLARRPLRLRAVVLALATAFPVALRANPVDPTVVVGHATFDSAGATLTVTNSAGAVIDWGSFSIGTGETTRFVQPSVTSAVLNRITGGDPSQILGTLTSNGQVFLINPNGIAFGPNAVVDVAGLVASTLPLSNADFAAGRFAFGADLGQTPGTLRVDGSLTSATGGRIWLIASSIEQRGAISAPEGQVILAAGQRVTIVDTYRPDVRVELAAGAEAVNVGRVVGGQIGIYGSVVRQDGLASATQAAVGRDGTVVLRAAATLSTGADSVTQARSADSARGGTIDARSSDMLWHDGVIDASGRDAGGTVTMTSAGIQQTGRVTAAATAGTGGAITQSAGIGSVVHVAGARLDASGGVRGGDIRVTSEAGRVFSSGTWTVTAADGDGGAIVTTGDSVVLAAATLDASGTRGGGDIRVGGGWRGEDAGIANSGYTRTLGGTALRANATGAGDGGDIVLWSDGRTRFAGTIDARGAGSAGNGGHVEVSGVDGVQFGGTVSTLGSGTGTRGTLLLDPKFILITAGGGTQGYAGVDFVDPNPTPDSETVVDLGSGPQDYGFGAAGRIQLGSSPVVIRAPLATVGSLTEAGAIYRLDATTGALIDSLTGAAAGDRIGSGDGDAGGENGLLAIVGDRYLLNSPFWNSERGAVTELDLGAANFGLSGSTIGSGNSLVGSTAGDRVSASDIRSVGSGDAIALLHADWGGGRGAITFIPAGASLPTGFLDSTRSFVGFSTVDRLATGGFVTLGSDHAAWVSSSFRSNTGLVRVFPLSSPLLGQASQTSSLIGGRTGDRVGETGVIAIDGSRYAVFSHLWNDQRGAVTFGNLGSPRNGVVDATNSLVGTTAGVNGDRVGLSYTTQFFNLTGSDRWLLASREWNNSRGAWTVVNPAALPTGTIDASNSLVGSTSFDSADSVAFAGGGGGNYFIVAPNWNNGVNADAGAVIRGVAVSNERTGLISSANAVVGSHSGDRIGQISGDSVRRFTTNSETLLIASPNWNGARGAITRVDATFSAGVVGASNSFVGVTLDDRIGERLIRLRGDTLTDDGNFIAIAQNYNNGAAANAGAVTFIHRVNGLLDTGDVTGTPNDDNSLRGTVENSRLGSGGVIELAGQDAHLILSPHWTNQSGAANADKGAITWMRSGDGRLSIGAGLGQLSADNSVLGAFGGDNIGHFDEDGDAGDDDATDPIRTTDIVGGFPAFGDAVGVVIRSPNWNGQRGAVTWMNAATGEISVSGSLQGGGTVGSQNSLVGTTAGSRGPGDARFRGDRIGEYFRQLDDFWRPDGRRYLIGSPYFDTARGAVMAFDVSNGTNVVDGARFGAVSASNALVGFAQANADYGGDQLGDFDSGTDLYTGDDSQSVARHVLVWRSGEERNVVVTWLGQANSADMAFGSGGISANTTLFIGADDAQSGVDVLTGFGENGFFVSTPGWSNGRGAVTWVRWSNGLVFTDEPFGAGITAGNSIVGSADFDEVSYDRGLFDNLSGSHLIGSTSWGGDRGAWRVVDGNVGAAGQITAGNGLVGANTGDRIGARGVESANPGSGGRVPYLMSPDWSGGRGALTDLTRTGVVGASNSLVGTLTTDRVGGTSLNNLTVDQERGYVIHSHWNGGRGAFTWLDGRTGEISAANSIVGANPGDRIGSGDVMGSSAFDAILWLRSPDLASGGVSANGVGAITPIASFRSGTVIASAGTVTTGAGGLYSLVGGGHGDRTGDVFGTRIERLSEDAFLVVSALSRGVGPRSAAIGSITFMQYDSTLDRPLVLGATTADAPVALDGANSLYGTGQFRGFAGAGGAVLPLPNDGTNSFWLAAPGADRGIGFDGSGSSTVVGAGRFWRVSVTTSAGGSGSVISDVLSDFGDPAGTLTISAADINATLTSNFLTLEATTDITLQAGAVIGPALSDGIDSSLTLRAGRSVILNGRLEMQAAELRIFAAYDDFNVAPDAGNGVISMGSGGRISGTGSIRLEGHTIGSAAAPIVFDTAPGASPVRLTSSGGGVFVAQRTGDLALSNYEITTGSGVTRELVAVAGNLLINANVAAAGDTLVLKTLDAGTPRYIDVVGNRTITADRAEFVMQPGGALRVSGVNNALTVTGGDAEIYGGVLNVANDAVATIDSDLFTPGIQLDGGTLTGSGAIDVGLFAWNGGALEGTSGGDAVTVTGSNATTVASPVTLTSRRLVTAPGIAFFAGNTSIALFDGARVETGRVTSAPGSGQVQGFFADDDASQVLMQGGLDKTGAGIFRVTANASAQGTFAVSAGAVEFGLPTGFTPVVVHEGANWTVTSGATLNFFAGDHTSTGAASMLGNGRVTVGTGVAGDTSAGANVTWDTGSTWGPQRTAISAGQLRLSGAITSGKLYDVFGGRLDLPATASAQMEQLSIAGGEVVNAGILSTAGFVQSDGDLRGTGQFAVTSSYNVTGGTMGADFTNVVITQASGNLTVAREIASAGGLTLRTPTGMLTLDAPVAGLTLTRLEGATGIEVRHAQSNGSLLQMISGGAIRILDNVVAEGAIAVFGASLAVDTVPRSRSAALASDGQITVVTTGDVLIRSNSERSARVTAGVDALCTFNVGGDVHIVAEDESSATIFGFPDIGSALSPFTVGGEIRFESDPDATARIWADVPTTIYLAFPNATSGGYTVNGVPVVFASNTGFFAGGQGAVIGSTMFVTYGNGAVGTPVDAAVGTEINTLVNTLRQGSEEPDDAPRRPTAPRVQGACK
ncbi:MAG: filamentous hemagglutinin N-terminal domain-containing protein [Burkholderiales bacterium]|nr:filamentous hemagglutinin N-terminal domain-containing protein [Burkholderiales bacterium]